FRSRWSMLCRYTTLFRSKFQFPRPAEENSRPERKTRPPELRRHPLRVLERGETEAEASALQHEDFQAQEATILGQAREIHEPREAPAAHATGIPLAACPAPKTQSSRPPESWMRAGARASSRSRPAPHRPMPTASSASSVSSKPSSSKSRTWLLASVQTSTPATRSTERLAGLHR